jgi:peptidoglycan/LPS O-acetylase OafA/YrhL
VSTPTENAKPALQTLRIQDVRLPQLDALRGLAALTVFFGHAIPMMPATPSLMHYIDATPVHLLYDGLSAVLLFFVLSGFVLNLKFTSGVNYRRHWVINFLVRRIFRIYPAFLAVVAIGLLLKHYAFNPTLASPFSDWFAKYWRTPVTVQETIRLLTLVGNDLNVEDNPVIWSLTYEMRISLLFPLVVIVVNRGPFWNDITKLVFVYIVGYLFCSNGTIRYLPHFFLGAFCAKYFLTMAGWLARLPSSLKICWVMISILLYQAKALVPIDHSALQVKYVFEQVAGIGAAGLVLACASFRALGTMLRRRLFQFIGVTSYSLYLVHFILLVALGPIVYMRLPSFALTWAVVLMVSYIIAFALFKAVEMPFNKWGHQLARAF